MRFWRVAAAVAVIGVLVAAAPAHAIQQELAGTFRITAGSCAGGAKGSYFRMINPTGTIDGPFVSNGDSGCSDKTYTLLSPGTQGGITTGAYQPAPSPGFDADGNSLAVSVIRPVKFFGVNFSASTESKDLQTGGTTTLPIFHADGSTLNGDLRAFDATWNKQAFNQGGPKPDGSTPGFTAPPRGTFDPATNKYSMTWTSQIVGGPFNNFTGLWHLEGTFVSATNVPTGSGRTTATTTRTAAGATATTVAGTTDTTTEVGGETVRRVAGKTVVHDGWEAPTGLVIVVATLGVLAVIALVLLDRRGATSEDAS